MGSVFGDDMFVPLSLAQPALWRSPVCLLTVICIQPPNGGWGWGGGGGGEQKRLHGTTGDVLNE